MSEKPAFNDSAGASSGRLVSGIVVKADESPDLTGKTVQFTLGQIDWESKGGVVDCVSIRDFGCVVWVHFRSMKLLGSKSFLLQNQTMRKNTSVLSILKSKTDKEILYLITAIFSVFFLLIMDIENVFSLRNIFLFLICVFFSFICNRALRQYLR